MAFHTLDEYTDWLFKKTGLLLAPKIEKVPDGEYLLAIYQGMDVFRSRIRARFERIPLPHFLHAHCPTLRMRLAVLQAAQPLFSALQFITNINPQTGEQIADMLAMKAQATPEAVQYHLRDMRLKLADIILDQLDDIMIARLHNTMYDNP